MEFCSCGGLIIPEKTKKGIRLACYVCRKEKKGVSIETKEKTKTTKWVEAVDQEVRDTEPQVNAECPKCGNNKAYFRTEQTRGADEPETQFFTCTKCGKVWREYE